MSRSSRVWTYLANNGPSTKSELPVSEVGLTPNMKDDGARVFKPIVHTVGSVAPTGGQLKPIYYLENKHSKEAVIRAYLKANPNLIDAAGPISVHKRICENCSSFKKASRTVLSEYGSLSPNPDGKTKTTDGGTCPFCGCEYPKALRYHLPCEESP